jgi:excisionase family DNA binding protein
MPQTIERDAEAIRRALENKSKAVSMTLSRDTAEFVSWVVAAKAQGKEIVVTPAEVTPAEAARILGMSRPQVRKIMDSGRLPYRMVGTHHRIALGDLREFKEAETARRRKAMKEYAEVQNELGLFE